MIVTEYWGIGKRVGGRSRAVLFFGCGTHLPTDCRDRARSTVLNQQQFLALAQTVLA